MAAAAASDDERDLGEAAERVPQTVVADLLSVAGSLDPPLPPLEGVDVVQRANNLRTHGLRKRLIAELPGHDGERFRKRLQTAENKLDELSDCAPALAEGVFLAFRFNGNSQKMTSTRRCAIAGRGRAAYGALVLAGQVYIPAAALH
jgi:hypothetical protein